MEKNNHMNNRDYMTEPTSATTPPKLPWRRHSYALTRADWTTARTRVHLSSFLYNIHELGRVFMDEIIIIYNSAPSIAIVPKTRIYFMYFCFNLLGTREVSLCLYTYFEELYKWLYKEKNISHGAVRVCELCSVLVSKTLAKCLIFHD